MEHGISLASTLNDLSLGRINAGEAEAAIRAGDMAHHVADPDSVLGLDPLSGTPLRLALAAVARGGLTTWQLLLPRPGRSAGLRGPEPVNRLAMEAGVLVVDRAGRGWLPRPVGPAMQWLLVRVSPVLAPPTPGEALQLLAETMAGAERRLIELDAPAGRRPSGQLVDRLGPGYPRRNHVLLQRSLLLHEACQNALAASGEVLSSHAVQIRETELRRIGSASLTGIESAVSWPL